MKTKPVLPETPKTITPQDFIEKYNSLCKETGFQIVYEPRWAQSKDTGDYRLVIIKSVAPLSDK